MENTPQTCPSCGKPLPQHPTAGPDGLLYCPACAQQRHLQWRLDHDPFLSAWNLKYSKYGLWKNIWCILLILALAGMKLVLDRNLSDSLGIVCMLLAPVALIGFVICCICRARLGKKLKQRLFGQPPV